MFSVRPPLLAASTPMHPRVRQLYKELIFAATVYGTLPLGTARERIKRAFRSNGALQPDSAEFKRALAWGRHEIRNMQATAEVKTFRSLRANYEPDDRESTFETPYSSLTAPKP